MRRAGLLLALLAALPATAGLEPLAWYGETRGYLTVAVAGDFIYAPAGGLLDVFSMTGDRLEPAGSVPLGTGDACALAAEDGWLVLDRTDAQAVHRVEILDLADPARPRPVARIADTLATGAVIRAPHLYLTVREAPGASLRTYGLDGPVPREISRQTLWEDVPDSAALAGAGQLLLATDRAGLRVFDLSDPARPQLRGSLGETLDAKGVTAEHDLAVVRFYGSLQLVDLSNPWCPQRFAGIPGGSLDWIGLSRSVLAGLDNFNGLYLYDVSSPELPRLLSQTLMPGIMWSARWLPADRLILAGHGLILLDVSSPESPIQLDRIARDEIRQRIALDGTLFGALQRVSNPDHILELVSIEDPMAPYLLSRTAVDCLTAGFLVRDDLLLVWNGPQLNLYDISDPLAPVFLTDHTYPCAIGASTLVSHCFYAISCGDLITLDLSSPQAPLETSRQPIGYEYSTLVAGDGVLYLATDSHHDENFIWPMSLSDPAHPAPRTPVLTGDWCHHELYLDGDRLLSVDHRKPDRIEVYGLSNPCHPTNLGSVPLGPFDTYHCLAAGGGVTLLSRDGKICAYLTEALPALVERGSYVCSSGVFDLQVDDRGLVAACTVDRIEILHLTDLPAALLAGWGVDPGSGEPVLRAWTGRPGKERLELTWDGLGTGLYLEPVTSGWYELPVEVDEIPAGRYLVGLRNEVNGPWRPFWPHLEVGR